MENVVKKKKQKKIKISLEDWRLLEKHSRDMEEVLTEVESHVSHLSSEAESLASAVGYAEGELFSALTRWRQVEAFLDRLRPSDEKENHDRP